MAQDRGFDLSQEPGNYQPGQGKNYVLAIGIDNYKEWPRLFNAVKDARDFVEVLLKQYQFEQGHVHTLFDDEATESGIYEKLREIKKTIGPHDNLLIYYSGHGYYDQDFDEGSWVPIDAQPNKEARYISNANIIQRVNAIGCQHLLLVVDSCFSGSLVVRKRNAVIDERFKSRRILASGRIESVNDGTPGKNSPFAEGVLTYLRKNTQPAVNTTSLIQYVKDFVAGKSNQSPVEGRINNSDDEGGEFVFRLRRSEAELWEEVKIKNTPDAYNDYLVAFQDGQFAAQARNRLLALREEETWQNALNNQTESAFENYIAKYAGSGNHLEEARRSLDTLKAHRLAQQNAREEMAREENKREKMKQQYAALVKTAEDLFQKKELALARDRYREALLHFLPGFAPNQEYLEEQINLCSTSISFLDYHDQGIKAMRQGNYRLAIPYFEEALTLNENPKVESLLRECKMHVQRQGTSAPPPPITPPPQGQQRPAPVTRNIHSPVVVQTPSKKSGGGWLAAILVITVLVIIGVVGYLIDEANSSGGSAYDPVYEDPGNLDEGNSDPGTFTPVDPTTVNFNLIQGQWYLKDITVEGYPVTNYSAELAALIGGSYYYQPNGTVTISSLYGTVNSSYLINGQSFTIQTLDQVSYGTITFLNAYNLSIDFPFDFGGITFQTKWDFSR